MDCEIVKISRLLSPSKLDNRLTDRAETALRRLPDRQIHAQGELAQVVDQKVIELRPLAIERGEPEAGRVVQARSADPDEAREELLVPSHARDVERKVVALLDGLVRRSVAGVVELEHADGRDDHLDAVNRVLLLRSLERLHRIVEELACSRAEAGDELMPRVGWVRERDASVAGGQVVDEFGDLVTGIAGGHAGIARSREQCKAGDTGQRRPDEVAELFT